MNPPRLTRSIWLVFLAALLVFLARQATAADDHPTSPSRLVPARGLTLYVEYDGLGAAHEAAWKATAAYAILNKTTTGSALSSVAQQVVDRLLKDVPGKKVSAADLANVFGHVANQGFALAIYDEGDNPPSVAIVLNGLGRKEARERSELLTWLLSSDNADGAPLKPIQVRGRTIFQIYSTNEAKAEFEAVGALPPSEKPKDSPPELIRWWFEGDDLIVTTGLFPETPPDAEALKADEAESKKDRVAAVLDAIEGKMANASMHPGRQAALLEGKDLKGFEPNGLVFVEMNKIVSWFTEGNAIRLPLSPATALFDPNQPGLSQIPPAPVSNDELPDAVGKADKPAIAKKSIDPTKLLGLDGVKRVIGRWGFQGKALLTDVRFEMTAPRGGLLALLDQPGLRTDRLPAVPISAKAVAIGSFHPTRSYESLIALAKTLDPDSAAEVDAALKSANAAVQDATGQRLREDLLNHLGPSWCVYTTKYQLDETETTVPALLVGIDDVAAFGKVLDALAVHVNKSLRGPQIAGEAKNPLNSEPPAVVLTPLPAPERGYRLISPEGVVPWLNDEISPTILLGKSQLIVALNPVLARAAATAELGPTSRWQPGTALANSLASLPDQLTSLSVGDPLDSAWPEGLATLPRTVQYLGNLLGASGEDAVMAPGLLSLVGVPSPGGFRIKINPSLVPKAAQVRALLFPSVLATVLDDRGLRFIGTEALPFACVSTSAKVNSKGRPGPTINLNSLFRSILN